MFVYRLGPSRLLLFHIQYDSHFVLFSRSEPYVEVETHSCSMKATLAFQRNRAQESSHVNQLNYSNCYVASVVDPDGVVVSTPD